MYDMLQRKNELIGPEAIDFTRRLVAIPSPSYQEADVADLVESEMQAIGFDNIFRDTAGNVIAILWGRSPEKTLLLNCHLDTAPVTDTVEWPHGPYNPVIENGRLYGAGTSDCKSGLAAQLYAVRLLKRAMLPLRHNLVIAATVAEEQGRSAGIRVLLSETLPKLGLHPDWGILGEPTDLHLFYGHDGWVEFELTVQADNAVSLHRAAHAITNDLRARLAHYPSTPEAVRFHEPRLQTDSQAVIAMNQRVYENQSLPQILQHIHHNALLALNPIGQASVSVAIRQEQQHLYTGTPAVIEHITHAWSMDPFHPLLDKCRHTLGALNLDAHPAKWQLGRVGMATAGGVLLNEFNIPTLGFGPGDEQTIHASNESVRLSNIPQAVVANAAIIHELIGTPVFSY